MTAALYLNQGWEVYFKSKTRQRDLQIGDECFEISF